MGGGKDGEDAQPEADNQGRSTPEPAEGADDAPPPYPDSPGTASSD